MRDVSDRPGFGSLCNFDIGRKIGLSHEFLLEGNSVRTGPPPDQDEVVNLRKSNS
jgi:hypothetical protein